MALNELSQKFSESPLIDSSKKIDEAEIVTQERKNSVSLIHELVQKNKGNIIIESNKVGENGAKIALFAATISIKIK